MAQRQVRGVAAGVLELGVAGDFNVPLGAGAGFGGLDQRSPDAPRFCSTQARHAPPFDERHRRRGATGRVFAIIQFQESDPGGPRPRPRRRRGCRAPLEYPPRLGLVVRQGTGPQRVACGPSRPGPPQRSREWSWFTRGTASDSRSLARRAPALLSRFHLRESTVDRRKRLRREGENAWLASLRSIALRRPTEG